MKLNKFDLGLSTRIDPSLIRPDEAVVYTNVDNDAIVLKPKNGLTATADASAAYFYYYNSAWVNSANDRDYLEYKNILYYTEPATYPKKYDGTNEYGLGIAKPATVPAEIPTGTPVYDFEGQQVQGIVVTQETPIASDFGTPVVSSEGATTVFAPATYDFRITLVSGTEEVSYTDIAYVLGANATNLKVSFSTYQGQTIKIYRKYAGTYRYLTTIILDGVKSYQDTVLDISANDAYVAGLTADGLYQYTMTYYNSADDIESAPMDLTKEYPIAEGSQIKLQLLPISTDPQVDKKRIYRIGGNLTNFTQVGEVTNATTTHYDLAADSDATEILETLAYDVIPATARGLVEAYGIFFAYVDSELIFSEIGLPDQWPLANSISFDKDVTGILPTSQGILVFTTYKSYIIKGTTKETFAKQTLSGDQGCISHKSCQTVQALPIWLSYDGVCSFQNGRIVVISKNQIGRQTLTIKQSAIFDEQYHLVLSDGTLKVFDFRRGMTIKDVDTNSTINGIGSFEGNLYVEVAGFINTVYTGSALTFTYKSPILSDGEHAMIKAYNNVYIRSDGVITVKIYINDILRLTKVLDTTKKINDVKPPQEYQRGANIQFEFTGTGTIHEIEFKAVGRKNGR